MAKLNLIACTILVVAFVVRLFDLSAQGLTTDEVHWIEFGSHFMTSAAAPWAQSGYALNLPTIAFIGLSMRWLPFLDVVAARFPAAIMGALTCVFLMFFIWRQYSPRIAVISTALLALDPLHIGLSRTAGTDAPLTLFMMLSLLSFFESERRQSLVYALVSGLSLGFAFMTKPNAMLVIPIIALYSIAISNWRHNATPSADAKRSRLERMIVWISAAALTVYLTWPDMWMNPTHAIITYLSSNFSIATSGHKNFFAGTVTDAPSLYYFLVIMPIRLPEITLIGLIIGIVWIGYKVHRKHLCRFESFLLCWLALFFAAMSIPSLKLEARYVLPIWPPLL